MKATKEIDSVCTYCGVGCDIVGVVEENQIQEIYAKKDGYVSQGKLCIKGKYGFDFVASNERIRTPLVKKTFIEKNPNLIVSKPLVDFNEEYFTCDIKTATSLIAQKLTQIKSSHGRHSFCGIGGARTNCESAFVFQKFVRQSMQSPHIDNCARVCHSPSLNGMRKTIGEGAATNPYNDIYKTEFMIVIGSNTTEAHPIIANRIVEHANMHDNLAVLDVREIPLSKVAKYAPILPFEANVMILNMLAYTILKDELYNEVFIKERTSQFEEYKNSILNDKYANPSYFENIKGYEYLAHVLPKIAREYALKKSMILWGLGITEHIDGSDAVMAIVNLALLTGNIGIEGAGLMPLRGQNNVQGACDMGCLPYYLPDYQTPDEIGLMTPQLVDEMINGKIKAVYNIGEDLMHIHPNRNKIKKGLENLELLVVHELFMTEVAKMADIVIGVKSAYEKEGVYINAVRRLHLSQPLVESDLLDDWEVLAQIERELDGKWQYNNSQDVWDEVRHVAYKRFSEATYSRLRKHRKRGLQWPVHTEDTPRLHTLDFRTDDGLGKFIYRGYKLRGQISELINNQSSKYYLTTGRTIAQYNNSAQTSKSKRLNDRYDEDILLISIEDEDDFVGFEKIILSSPNGQTSPLSFKFTNKLKKGTMFVTFHHAKSAINVIFGDEADSEVMTARFKSIKVDVLKA